MGSGASAGISAALEKANVEEVKVALAALSQESRARIVEVVQGLSGDDSVSSDLATRAGKLLESVELDGSRWDEQVKVEPMEGMLKWYAWKQGSLFGMGGQMDYMSPEDALAMQEEAAKYRWVYQKSYEDEIKELCGHYKAEGLYDELSAAGLGKAEGKGVAFLKALEELLRSTWSERCSDDCPELRGFLKAPGTWGQVQIHP
eukprot:TRINITY_DN65428_c0_g1_i1.p1 TRINITY_DN65428_c0_g1~~TRINITY_DN65428_c0_g1_i1.p1  ORF type:complete len:203 (-),score=38.17 TRINITY_DN65428_c0_g1_i1:365-973(-)